MDRRPARLARDGTDAVAAAAEVTRKAELLRGNRIPREIGVTATRDDGKTAPDKSDESLLRMGLAVVGVSLWIAGVLGCRKTGAHAEQTHRAGGERGPQPLGPGRPARRRVPTCAVDRRKSPGGDTAPRQSA